MCSTIYVSIVGLDQAIPGSCPLSSLWPAIPATLPGQSRSRPAWPSDAPFILTIDAVALAEIALAIIWVAGC